MTRKWKIINRSTILTTKWVKLYQDTIQLPSGKIIDDYYVAEKVDVAMVAAFNNKKEIVLIREYKHGIKEFVWQLPAGGIDPGSDPEDVAKQELLQETGFLVKNLHFLGSWYVAPPFLTNKVFGYFAIGALNTSFQNLDETENIEVFCMSFDKVLSMVLRNEIRDAPSCVIILQLARMNILS